MAVGLSVWISSSVSSLHVSWTNARDVALSRRLSQFAGSEAPLVDKHVRPLGCLSVSTCSLGIHALKHSSRQLPGYTERRVDASLCMYVPRAQGYLHLAGLSACTAVEVRGKAGM